MRLSILQPHLLNIRNFRSGFTVKIASLAVIVHTILGSEMIDNLNIKTKMLNFELRVLIGWLSQNIR